MRRHTHELTFGPSEVRKRFVGWADGEADREWLCLSLLAVHAPGVAPRPIRREHERGAPVVVMERLPGYPLAAQPASADQTAALGRALRRLYAVPLTALHDAGLPERRVGPSAIEQVLISALRAPRALEGCEDPDLIQETLELALWYLARRGSVPEAQLTTMGIADLNPANVLWDGQQCRLVDFEDGGLTEPAFELADYVEHIASRLSGVYDPDLLADAVGLQAAERHRFEKYRVLWAIFWILMLLPGKGGFARNPPGTTEAQAQHIRRLLATAGE